MKNLWCVFTGELPDEIVQAIIKETYKYEYKKAEIGTESDEKGLIVDTNVRRSDIKFINSYKSKFITDLIMHYTRIANRLDFGFDIDGVQDIQYTEYNAEDKGFYDWHTDAGWCDNSFMFQRKISMSIQLSDGDEYEGGDFEIQSSGWEDFCKSLPDGGIRSKGTIIVFPSFASHRVTPVTKGTRKSLVSWIDGSMFR